MNYFEKTGYEKEQNRKDLTWEEAKNLPVYAMTYVGRMWQGERKVSDEEVEAEMQKMADAYKMELDKVKEYLGEAGKDSLKDDLAVQKAVDLIVDSAK